MDKAILLNYLEKNPKPLRSLKIYGNYLFASSIFGFDVYNISNPTNPTVVFQYTGCCPNDYSIEISGSYLYYLEYPNGIKVFNISNPQNPTIVGFVNIGFNFYSAYVSGNYLFACSSPAFVIYNISNPSNLTYVSSYQSACHYAIVSNNLAYILDQIGNLDILDISNINSPSLIASLGIPNALSMVKSNNYLYVMTTSSGIKVVDVSNSNSPSLVSSFNTNGLAIYGFLNNNTLYLANFNIYGFSRKLYFYNNYIFSIDDKEVIWHMVE